MAPAAPVSSEALSKDLARYRSLRGLEAEFRQTKTLQGMSLTLKSAGHFRLTRTGSDAEIEWVVKDPAYLKLRITPTALLMSENEGDAGKPVVDNADATARILRPLYAWLSMDAARIAENYAIDDKGKNEFELTPKDKSAPVKQLRIHLDARKLVDRVVLRETSGDELRIEFSGTKETSK